MTLKIKRKKTERQKEKEYLDKLVSEYIRRRAMQRIGGCERCLSQKKSYKDLDWAHCKGRNALSVRWDPDNGAGLCGGCHMYLDSHHNEKDAWFEALIGKEAFRKLEIRKDWRVGEKKLDLKELITGYRILLARLAE